MKKVIFKIRETYEKNYKDTDQALSQTVKFDRGQPTRKTHFHKFGKNERGHSTK